MELEHKFGTTKYLSSYWWFMTGSTDEKAGSNINDPLLEPIKILLQSVMWFCFLPQKPFKMWKESQHEGSLQIHFYDGKKR